MLYLRFTNREELDLIRQTSIHTTPFESLQECEEYDSEKEYVLLENGNYGMLIEGLCGYVLESLDRIDAIKEIKAKKWDYDLNCENLPWVIFSGVDAFDAIPDGDCFIPETIIYKKGLL